MNEQPWYFGLLRQSGSYQIVASGPTEARVRRALAAHDAPTLIVTREDLPALGLGEREWRRWLPQETLPQSRG